MLSEINPDKKMEKHIYKETIKIQENKLANLQLEIRKAGLPVVIVLEGWSASGKGTHMARILNPLDPRYFDVRTTGNLTDEKIMRPFLWSYWSYLPPAGQIVIMDKSWHRLILPEWKEAWRFSTAEEHGFYFDVNAFERQLSDGGYLIIKLFLHIDKEEQHRRLKALEKDPSTAWRVNDLNREQNKNYDHYLRLYEKILNMTNNTSNPWHIIEANDRRFGTCKIMQTIINAVESRLAENKTKTKESKPEKIPNILRNIIPEEKISHKEYNEKLEYYQERLKTLTNKMYTQRRSAVIVYEGWDAAGKGGNIKRLTSEMDPRCYTVVPIGPPRPYELTRQFLWRFMVKMPKDGHITIFDRSWYGRVLVERVEGLTPEDDWRRAYREINEFEQHIVGNNTVLLKFWLHIDKDEQLRRFESRQNDPDKQHKITEEDWRNREKWDEYETAVDEMLMHTDKPHAPWIIVESNSKKFARTKVLQTVTDALEETLR